MTLCYYCKASLPQVINNLFMNGIVTNRIVLSIVSFTFRAFIDEIWNHLDRRDRIMDGVCTVQYYGNKTDHPVKLINVRENE